MDTSKNRATERDDPSTRRLNRERKKLSCLGCGREIFADRCHRFCRTCQRRNRRGHFYLPKIGRLSHGPRDN